MEEKAQRILNIFETGVSETELTETLKTKINASTGSSLGSIKPTDAAPTPARNGNYTFSIGGAKPAWLTAKAGITEVKAGDGVAVVYTEPSSYTYTHVDTGSGIEQARSQSTSKVPSSKLVDDELNKIDIYNVTVKVPLPAGQFYTATTARAAVPTGARALGKKITYATASGVWVEEMFIGADVSGWVMESNWKDSKELYGIIKTSILTIVKTANKSIIPETSGVNTANIFNDVYTGYFTNSERIHIVTTLYNQSSYQLATPYAFFDINGVFISDGGTFASNTSLPIDIYIIPPTGAVKIVVVSKNTIVPVITSYYNSINNSEQNVADIISGQIPVSKAIKDANGNVINTTYATISDVTKLQDLTLNMTKVFDDTSVWITSGSYGMTKAQAISAFKQFYINSTTNIYIRQISQTTKQIVFLNISDNTLFGNINNVDFTVNEYKLYPIAKADGSVVGYTILNASYLTLTVLDTLPATLKPIIIANIFEYIKFIGANNANTVILEGDSLTAIGSGYSNFVEIEGYNIARFGDGGETTLQIAARSNAIPMYVDGDITIPASAGSTVTLTMKSSWNDSPMQIYHDIGFNPVTIRGVEGTLTHGTTTPTFTRTYAGNETIIKSGEKIITMQSKYYNNGIVVIQMGTNGGFTDANDYMNQLDAIINQIASGKYLIVTWHTYASQTADQKAKLLEIENLVYKKYGARWLSLRKWALNYGIEECGISPTSEDINALSTGNTPPSILKSDLLHFSDEAREAQGNWIVQTLKNIGYVI